MEQKLPLLILLSFCFALNAIGQSAQKQNPVVFADVSFGHTWGGAGGFTGNGSLNFQTAQSLFTARYVGTTRMEASILFSFIPLPVFEDKSSLEEFSLLYGRRFVKTASAYSFSLGLSYSTLRETISNTFPKQTKTTAVFGVPFEANIKWFKPTKEPYRIYGIIPVGKPTAFGRSIGFKLLGTFSQNSYAGLAVSYGLGYHKKYQ